MFRYLFTNDLRISRLKDALVNASVKILTSTVPPAYMDKNENNNILTIASYFGLTEQNLNTEECSKGNTQKTIINFIKKFQFPNTRTQESLKHALEDQITLAPMRVVVQTLFIMGILNPDNAYLTRNEIKNFIFYNTAIAKTKSPDLLLLAKQIISSRNKGHKLPPSIETDPQKRQWSQEERQLREMCTILTYTGFVSMSNSKLYINKDSLSIEDKENLFDILHYSDFWECDNRDDFDSCSTSYNSYMNLDSPSSEKSFCASRLKKNKIFFGAPGTGKSYALKRNQDEYFKPSCCERVTFHPDYTYSNFIGCYKPVSQTDGKISYEFVPGPFIRILKKARTTGENYLLVIEEINRAKVAAVFGDVFQLLDRNKYGASEYPIAPSEELKKYLNLDDDEMLAIPSNMHIWATINSADQGVFPMDTAFRRRWDFEYIGVDDQAENIPESAFSTQWDALRRAINDRLESQAGCRVNEDKLLGPFFIKVDHLNNTEEDKKEYNSLIKDKVLSYLFDDAAKHSRSKIFNVETMRYSEICKLFNSDKPNSIFVEEIAKGYENWLKELSK